jgi:hypothetical protein
MCGRVHLSSDSSDIKIVFSIPPHRPTPNFPPTWNAAPTDALPVVRYDAKAGEGSLDVIALGLVPFWGEGRKPTPELDVTITPSRVTIPDNSKRGTPLATVSVRWSDGAPFSGKVRLTKNQEEICQLAGMQLQLGRDTTKADDYTTPVYSVTAIE